MSSKSKPIILYLLLITLAAFGGCRKTIEENIEPDISFAQPQNNALFSDESVIVIVLKAKDEDGSIAKIELILDGILIHTFVGEPWEFELAPATIGSGAHFFEAIAYDDHGAKGVAILEILIDDERDGIIGDYFGIEVYTHWVNSTSEFAHDTSDVTATIRKSYLDSIVEISFAPTPSLGLYSFLYRNGDFMPTTVYHPATLEIRNDSLYFWHQPALGPYWFEFFTYKVK